MEVVFFMRLDTYVDGDINLKGFISFISNHYYVDVYDDRVELLPFNNMQLPEIMNSGKFR